VRGASYQKENGINSAEENDMSTENTDGPEIMAEALREALSDTLLSNDRYLRGKRGFNPNIVDGLQVWDCWYRDHRGALPSQPRWMP
jgi:hypothetical protein